MGFYFEVWGFLEVNDDEWNGESNCCSLGPPEVLVQTEEGEVEAVPPTVLDVSSAPSLDSARSPYASLANWSVPGDGYCTARSY